MSASTARNITLYPWYRAAQGLLFWQAIWFLYFQNELSASQAVLLYVVFDLSATVLEVPLGVVSDKIGRRITLMASCLCGALGAGLIALGSGFEIYALANVLLGAWAALASGADSAFLYESLQAEGRADEVEAQELRGWRSHFTALGLSAIIGGLMAYVWPSLPYVAVTVALLWGTFITYQFVEPAANAAEVGQTPGLLGSLSVSLSKPILIWLFVLGLLMYGFSHVPFVFGQPFIQEVLTGSGAAATAPIVSGAVTSLMMLLSLLASLITPTFRKRFGLRQILLAAFALQVVLIGALVVASSMIAIALLMLRMVPNALFGPFLQARIQPELENESRATFLSLQSLCGRLLFAASLYLASFFSSDTGEMVRGELTLVLGAFTLAGALALIGLALWSRRISVETPPLPKTG